MKTRRALLPPTRGATRGSGRGGARGGSERGARGGRGRGGVNGRVASGDGEEGQARAQARPKPTQRQPSQTKPATEGQAAVKPSIYKSAQPAPPKSAPIH